MIGDLVVQRGGDRRFRHDSWHMVAVCERVVLGVRVLALLAVKLGNERIVVAGRGVVRLLFAAGGKVQQQKRREQRGGQFFHRLLFSDLKGLVFSAIIADFCKSATAFRARQRAPIDRIPTRL